MIGRNLAHRSQLRESGSASVAALAIVAAIALTITTLGALIAIANTRSSVQGAANLAALAAATEWNYVVPGSPCERAETVARKNGGDMTNCEIHGSSVQVVVQASPGALPWAKLSGTARAGPAPIVPGPAGVD